MVELRSGDDFLVVLVVLGFVILEATKLVVAVGLYFGPLLYGLLITQGRGFPSWPLIARTFVVMYYTGFFGFSLAFKGFIILPYRLAVWPFQANPVAWLKRRGTLSKIVIVVSCYTLSYLFALSVWYGAT